MKRWHLRAESETPDGRRLSLHEHDGAFSLRVDGAELMNTRQHGSEEKLAELVCGRLKDRKNAPRVLIGGLGFGFTLKAALAALPAEASVVVAELIPAVVEWNRVPEYGLAAEALADPRTKVVVDGVETVLASPGSRFDGIMLDVDNGPDALVASGNGRLYQEQGLLMARGALRPGGRLGVWSAAQDRGFEKLMGRAGFTVEVVRVKARITIGGWHTLYIGS